jgi:hypothetical protein
VKKDFMELVPGEKIELIHWRIKALFKPSYTGALKKFYYPASRSSWPNQPQNWGFTPSLLDIAGFCTLDKRSL